MGYDTTRFQGEVDEDLICPICKDVLEEPLHAPKCEHAFCKSCIHDWLKRQQSCPVDRQPMSAGELKPAPRILRNFLSRLSILCDNATLGCTAVVKLEHLDGHRKECEHNPKRPMPSEQGWGLVNPKDEWMNSQWVQSVPQMSVAQSILQQSSSGARLLEESSESTFELGPVTATPTTRRRHRSHLIIDAKTMIPVDYYKRNIQFANERLTRPLEYASLKETAKSMLSRFGLREFLIANGNKKFWPKPRTLPEPIDSTRYGTFLGETSENI